MDNELLILAGSAIVGLAVAGYGVGLVVGNAPTNMVAIGTVVLGGVLLAIPLVFYKSNEGWGSAFRMLTGVAGVALVARGLFTVIGMQEAVGPILMNVV